MIQCANCETNQCLQITQSRIYFENGNMVSEISEEYECTLCGATGGYVADDDKDEKRVTGDMEKTDNQNGVLWP